MQQKLQRHVLWILCVIVAMTAGFTIGIGTTKKLEGKQQHPIHPVTDTLPPVISQVKKVKVVSAVIERQGTPGAMAAITVLNDSDKGITGITLTFEECTVGLEGGVSSDEEVETVIEPHSTETITISVRDLETGVPIYVGGVIYADHTEDGKEAVLELMHRMRETDKAKRDVQKGAPQQ